MWKKIRYFFLIETYLLSIKKKLYYPKKTKQRIIKRLRNFINQACAEDETVISCQQDIYDMLGTADKIVSDYMQLRLEDEAKQYEAECTKDAKFSKIKSILFLICLVLLIFVIIFLIWSYWMHEKNIEIGSHDNVIVETSVDEEGR